MEIKLGREIRRVAMDIITERFGRFPVVARMIEQNRRLELGASGGFENSFLFGKTIENFKHGHRLLTAFDRIAIDKADGKLGRVAHGR